MAPKGRTVLRKRNRSILIYRSDKFLYSNPISKNITELTPSLFHRPIENTVMQFIPDIHRSQEFAFTILLPEFYIQQRPIQYIRQRKPER